MINFLVPVAVNSALFYFLPSAFPAVFAHQLMTGVMSTMIDKEHWLKHAPSTYLLISQTFLKQYAPQALIPPALSIESLVEQYGKTAYPAVALSCIVANKGPTLLVNGAKKGLHWMLGNQRPEQEDNDVYQEQDAEILPEETPIPVAPRRSERLAGKPRPNYRQ